MNGGPSGFNNAPVTRSFVVASAIFTVFSGIQGRSHKLGLSYQDVYQKVNFWKIVESAFAFSSTPELMFGLYMLYYFRVFERQIGSNKYSVFIVFSSITSILCEVLALALLKDTSLKFTPGPYGLIFASFIPFYLDIPVSTKIRVFGVQFSDKSFIYLAGLQLLLSSWRRSIFPGICGFVAGSLYRLNFFYIRKAKPNYPAPVPSTPEPSEASIAALVSMGFDRSSARQALIQARNDVNVATNILLESQSQ
ncbi:rhomboid-like protein 20 isoform X2 [Rhodamnia argentea]|uniref:Rhomboid-like protein 20 isoform X2 n=1 Tax=Rhodamnia argentea TaxID=178133 RepID=A0ABM3GRZ5_9MYRT|nr:rhomboid-like protein 20 isoform X2 [Rhodamnia argentea]